MKATGRLRSGAWTVTGLIVFLATWEAAVQAGLPADRVAITDLASELCYPCARRVRLAAGACFVAY